ncbi:MAG: cobalamin-binding protein [Sphingomonas sanxanigenens]|uniref:Cobalamin-binding protein n=1 Tax=Sphingomonas sanxanigenens TaxID=397260 RepID=A0A2W5A4I5_9SPHN|nr:MAG: cobalamin-binding protein [Sphingomonas sanxanigenens]
MTGLRIVSLLPSATEVAVALGFEANLVGRSHECDFPPAVSDLPVCTATKLEKGLSSGAIDRRVQEIVQQGLSVYEVHAALLKDLRPDVILTQTQCAICAVTPDDLSEALNSWVGDAPALVSLAPDNLDDVWGDFRSVGAALAIDPEPVIAGLKARLDDLRRRVSAFGRPRVAAIEWIEPLMGAGNWIPELIGIAGGESLLATPGEHSPWVDFEALAAADPDVIVLMPCGFQIPQTIADMPPLTGRAGWRDLRAVRDGRVYAADGHHFFNRPGPRLIESAEILAELIHDGKIAPVHHGRGWVRVEGD